MPKLDETILECIRKFGPSTPVEVAQKTGANSLIVAAVLIDAVSQQKIKKSKRSVGSMRFYYYADQSTALQRRINSLLTPQDKQMLQKLMQDNVISEYELQPPEVSVLSNLEDLINGFTVEHNGQLFRCWSSPNMTLQKSKELALGKMKVDIEVKQEVLAQPQVAQVHPNAPQVAPKVEEAKPVEVKIEKPKEKKKTADKEKIRKEVLAEMGETFKDNVLKWLEKQNIEVIEEREVKEGKEYEMDVKVPTAVGKQNYWVKIFDFGKKAASQSDISGVGTDAASKRIPAIIVSSTGFAKSATKYWKKELQDMVTLVSKEDLE